jgi:hypothetical protein
LQPTETDATVTAATETRTFAALFVTEAHNNRKAPVRMATQGAIVFGAPKPQAALKPLFLIEPVTAANLADVNRP